MLHFGIGSPAEFDVIATDYSFGRRLLNTNLRYRKLEADYIKTKLDIDFRRLLYVDHHAAHAASVFYPSPFEEAAVLVVDGVGSEGNTNSLELGAGPGAATGGAATDWVSASSTQSSRGAFSALALAKKARPWAWRRSASGTDRTAGCSISTRATTA